MSVRIIRGIAKLPRAQCWSAFFLLNILVAEVAAVHRATRFGANVSPEVEGPHASVFSGLVSAVQLEMISIVAEPELVAAQAPVFVELSGDIGVSISDEKTFGEWYQYHEEKGEDPPFFHKEELAAEGSVSSFVELEIGSKRYTFGVGPLVSVSLTLNLFLRARYVQVK